MLFSCSGSEMPRAKDALAKKWASHMSCRSSLAWSGRGAAGTEGKGSAAMAACD